MVEGPHLMIAAGGTGGHMFPAQALAEAMLARGWRVTLSTDARGARYTQNFPKAVEIDTVSSATFARGGALAKLLVPFRILRGVAEATLAMRRDRPAIVVGFGGYPSIPAVVSALLLRIPRLIHEQNGVLGRVNQALARRVNAVACGTTPTELPEGVDGYPIGNPVRATILEKAGAAYIPPGNYPMNVVIIGGSQGARILSDVVPPALSALPLDMVGRLRVAHQARPEDIDRVKTFYHDHGIAAEVEAFFDDVPRRFAEAQLIIARSGASTVADLSVIGRPSILIPLATAIRDEQTANARGLVAAQAAVAVSEAELTPDTLAGYVEGILSNSALAQDMARNALTEGKPDATERLVDMVETFAETGKITDDPPSASNEQR